MIDPRPCDDCRRDVELAAVVYSIVIDAERMEPDIRRQLCPRCARAEFRRRRFGSVDDGAPEAARALLEPLFGEALRITWLQHGDRCWAVLCRRQRSPRPPDPAGRSVPPGAGSPAPASVAGRPIEVGARSFGTAQAPL